LTEASYLQVAAFARLDEAEVARGLLESEGIQVALLDTQASAPGLGPAAGGVRVLVPAWDAGRASELLADPPRADPEELGRTPAPLPVPPRGAVPAAPGPMATRIAVWVVLALAGAAVAMLL
jgi:hypothetical protein